jgi:hypothetical protein
MESPDGGQTVTKRKMNDDEKFVLNRINGRWFPLQEAMDIANRAEEDEKLRAEYPAIQEAWEQYQLLLNMARKQKR